mgnify:CR=1 FL=1
MISQAQLEAFDRDGYLLVENLFDAEEMDLLMKIGKADQEKVKNAIVTKDTEGGESKLWITADEGVDIYNAIVHSHRIVDRMELLMRDDVSMYHYKMMLKEPRVGGAWEWHQDYGYWYNNGCLYPDMASCMIAVDRASKANGCLQVIRGSHKLGRIEHGTYGTQVGADPERVKMTLQHLDLDYCEMQPGTALFFHANLLHRSDQNKSEHARWSLICCYNTKHNPSINLPGHSDYKPLEKWPDSRIKELGRKQWAELRQVSTEA